MPALTLALTLALVSPAVASPLPSAGAASASGVVEVPLLAGPERDDPYFYVAATVGEETLLLRLVTEHPYVLLSEAAMGRIGAKATGKDKPHTALDDKRAKIASMGLGAATLTDVLAHPYAGRSTADLGVDGEIGLAGFADVAWAFVPSKGVLRLTPTAEAGPLLAAIGGTTVPFNSYDAEKVKVGKDKTLTDVTPYVIPVTYSGVAVPTALRLGVGTRLSKELEGGTSYRYADVEIAPISLPAAPKRGTTTLEEWRALSVAGTEVWTWVARPGRGPVYRYAVNGDIGVDVLGSFDFAIDPARQTLVLKGGVTVLRGDGAALVEARLKKAVDTAGAEASDATAKADARRGALVAYADFLHARGALDAEIPLRKEVADGEPEVCAHWLGYGTALLGAARSTEATDALSRADALYAPWAKVPLADRVDQQAQYDKATKAKKAWEGTRPQSHTCDTAVGLLATARLQQRDGAGVTALYPARADLDASLPTAAGILALREGRFEEAQAAFRQADRLDGVAPNAEALVGLFLAYQGTNLAQARDQLERIRFRYRDRTDPLAVELYGAALRASGEAVTGLKAAVAGAPGDAVLLTQLGVEQRLAGDAAGATQSFIDAEARFKAAMAAGGGGSAMAEYAWFLSASGKPADARPVADQATKLMPDSGLAWLAMARAEADPARAAEYLARAGRTWVQNPGYALLMP